MAGCLYKGTISMPETLPEKKIKKNPTFTNFPLGWPYMTKKGQNSNNLELNLI